MLPRLNRSTEWRHALYVIIFEADTTRGRLFDTVLLAAILVSSLAVTLESVPGIRNRYAELLHGLDWGITILFSIEYILRLLCVPRPRRYALSFYGIIDLLAILPQFIALALPQSRFLAAIRILRLLRIFRIFRLTRYLNVAHELNEAMAASRQKIVVFLSVVLVLAIVLGTLMYVIEGEENGFTSIPISIYWAIVTLTTVGFGDITPKTPLGQGLASIVMIMGYGIIAVPTGIVSAGIVSRIDARQRSGTRLCPHCFKEGHDWDAVFCKFCSGTLPAPNRDTHDGNISAKPPESYAPVAHRHPRSVPRPLRSTASRSSGAGRSNSTRQKPTTVRASGTTRRISG
jgi:voltage-gated potassium channel